MADAPDGPPPAYEEATGSKRNSTQARPFSSSSRLDVPRNGIPTSHRRSMEDEGRSLPPGWVRQFDAKEAHQFFVDTDANPPRSIWHHPYDDEQYLSTLTSEERELLQSKDKPPSKADIAAESSADDSDIESPLHKRPPPTSQPRLQSSGPFSSSPLPPRPQNTQPSHPPKGIHKIGRRFKDSLLGSNHEERAQERLRRAEEEREAHARYQQMRSAMVRAAETGQPQLLGKTAEGKDVYMEPPRNDPYGNPLYSQQQLAGNGAPYQAYNPYIQGPYANPNNRFVAYPRPDYAYGRPGGYGYGGGLGLPLVGGLLGGALLGGILF